MTKLVSAREVIGLDRVEPALLRFEDEWRSGRPDLARHLAESGVESVALLAALVKVDLRCRFDIGERPDAAEYLERFPALTASGDRVLSLVYEEYCLREERDGRPDTAEFCARYGPWKDSLESQLRYHRVLSRVVGSGPAPVRFPEPGERFEQFLIESELGRGAAGRVYLARDESLGDREVALKVSQDRGSEPSTLGRLRHAHIVPVHSVVTQHREGATLRGLCMPYRKGLPLDEVIRRVNPVSRPARALVIREAVHGAGVVDTDVSGGWSTFPTRGTYAEGVAWIVAALAEALGHAHGQQIYHRDVKPANILLTDREGPQLLDFNLSHDPHSAVEAEAALRGGTLPYMAPEQLEAFLDPARWDDVVGAADLYSLGLVLRELLTGRAPETPDPSLPLPRLIRALLDQRADGRADLRHLNPRVPHALDAIAGRCLAFAPADRYRDAADLVDDLRRFLARRPLKHARNRSFGERAVNRVVRHRVVLAIVAVSAVLMAAFGYSSPVERRADFTKAVADLDAGRADDALDALNRLGPDARRSPLVAFYAAAAYARAERGAEADAALERAWSRPGAGVVLTGWGRSHPALAPHAERLGGLILARASRVEPPLKAAVLGRAEETFRLVRRLDPSRYRASLGLAVIDEGREKFDPAHHALTALIASLGVPRTVEGRERLSNALMTRARVLTRWASSLSEARANEAEGHLNAALADLDRGDTVVPPSDNALRFELAFIRCGTILAFAKLATGQGRPAAAINFYRRAERLIASLGTHPANRDAVFQALETKVRKSLATEVPRLDALIRASVPHDAG